MEGKEAREEGRKEGRKEGRPEQEHGESFVTIASAVEGGE